jgi:hypothetical protein
VKDNILAKNGVVLRLRKQDEDLNTISMKWVNPEVGNFLKRYELEVETLATLCLKSKSLEYRVIRKIVELIGSEALGRKVSHGFYKRKLQLRFWGNIRSNFRLIGAKLSVLISDKILKKLSLS